MVWEVDPAEINPVFLFNRNLRVQRVFLIKCNKFQIFIKFPPLFSENPISGKKTGIGKGYHMNDSQERSQKYLEGIFETSSEGIFVVEADGHILRSNPAFEKMLRFENDELKGKMFSAIVHDKSARIQKLTSQIKTHHFKRSSESPIEMELIDKEGTALPVRLRSTLIKDDKGKIVEAIGMIEDLREDKGERVSEQTIQETQETLDNILSNSGDAIFVADANGRITIVNNALLQMLEYQKDEIMGMHLTELSPYEGILTTTTGEKVSITEEYLNYQVERANELFKKGKVANLELYFNRKDGKIVPVEATISVLKNQRGERRGSIAICRDITKRKQIEKALKKAHDELEKKVEERTADLKAANEQLEQEIIERKRVEEALMKSEERYHNLIEFANAGIMVAENNKITHVNRKAEEIYDYSKEELIGQSPSILTPEKYREQHREIFDEISKWGKARKMVFEEEGIRKDGSIFPIEISFTLTLKEENMIIAVVRDITKRKRAEKEIKESKDFLENVFKTSADGILVSDSEGFITMVNDTIEKMLDYSRDELIGKHSITLSPKDEFYEEIGKEFIEKLMRDGVVTGYELFWLRKDGRLVDIEINSVLIKDKEGNRKGSVTSIRDITERKKMERTLRETKEFLEKVFENTADGIMIFDLNGNIIDANSSIEKMTDLKKTELIGKHASILIDEDKETREIFIERAAELFKTGYTSYESAIRRRDGKHIEVEYNCSLIKDAKGEYIAGVSVLRDVTERKRTEGELRRTRDYLDNIIESSLDAIIIADLHGYTTRVNKSFQKLTGYKEEEIIGKHVFEFSPLNGGIYESAAGELVKLGEEFYKDSEKNIVKLFEERKINNWESYYLHKNGKLIPVDMNIVVFHDKEGESFGTVGMCRDITERRRAEKEREMLLGELKGKNKELEQIFYVASHDLRSPLVNVQGFSKELSHAFTQVQSVLDRNNLPPAVKENLAPALEEDIPEALQYIHTSIAKMDSLLSGLLRLSRLGRAALKIKELDMNKLLSDIVKTFEYRIKEKGITPQIDELPP